MKMHQAREKSQADPLERCRPEGLPNLGSPNKCDGNHSIIVTCITLPIGMGARLGD